MTDTIQKVSGGRIFGLDAVRALAIALVLLGHGKALFRGIFPQLGELEGGLLGVELFFVLSGFLIGQILIKIFSQDATFDHVRTFMVRRWLRTLPNYFLFLMLNLTVFAYVRPFEGIDGRYFLFLQNLAWDQPGFFNESWSLAVEEWFYLLMPALLLLTSFWRSAARQHRILLAIAGMLVIPLMLRSAEVMLHAPDYATTIRQTVIFRLDSLAFGVLAAYVKYFHAELWSRHVRHSVRVALPALIILLYVNFSYSKDGNALLEIFFLPAVSLVFALFMPWADSVKTCRHASAQCMIENASLWSYSLYLAHLPLLYAALAVQRSSGNPDLLSAAALWVSWIAVSVAMSCAVYRYFEKPAMDLREKLFSE